MNPITRLLFNPKDDPLFNYLNDDGQRVEPEWYCPIIPTVLINGAEGIGTGWSTKIPNYNPREIIENIRLMIDGKLPKHMIPYFKNFRGNIQQLDDTRVFTSGVVSIIDENTIEITELPIGVWTQIYKESVLESYLHGQDVAEKKIAPTIIDYREYHTDTTVRFVVKMSTEQFKEADKVGFHKFFKLQKTLSLNSMVLFDPNGCLKRYENINEILKEFFEIRMNFYSKRKAYMEGMLGAEKLKLDNIARFILEKIDGIIKVENLKKAEICKMLREKNYDPDPVLKWKESITKDSVLEESDQTNENEDESQSNKNKEFDYLLGMPIWNLTTEKKDEILKQQLSKSNELKNLKAKSPSQLWIDDLDQFLLELDKFEAKEKEDESVSQLKAYKASLTNKTGSKINTLKKTIKLEYLPSEDGELVEVKLDPILAKESNAQRIKKEDKKELNLVDIITSNQNEFNEQKVREFIECSSKIIKKETKKSPKKISSKKRNDDDAGNDNESIASSKMIKAAKKNEAIKDSNACNKQNLKSDPKSIKSYFTKTKKTLEESDISMEYLSDDSNLTESQPIERKISSRVRKEVKYINDDSNDDEEIKLPKIKDDSDYDNDVVFDDVVNEVKILKKADKQTKATDSKLLKEKPKIQKNAERDEHNKDKDGQGLLRIKKNDSKTALKRHNNIESDQDSENKPPNKTSKKNEITSLKQKETSNIIDFFKPKQKQITDSKKSKYAMQDDDSFVVDDSSDEDFELKSKSKTKPKAKKLLAINNYDEKVNSRKIVKNNFQDDDLYEIN
jgi:DNA topoisomerase-2